jgi:hypothetical protein
MTAAPLERKNLVIEASVASMGTEVGDRDGGKQDGEPGLLGDRGKDERRILMRQQRHLVLRDGTAAAGQAVLQRDPEDDVVVRFDAAALFDRRVKANHRFPHPSFISYVLQ